MYTLENDTTSINIDDYFVSFETGLPEMSYKMETIIGDGGIITGVGSLAGRKAKISRSFVRTDFNGRQTFIDWFTKPNYETIYLRWQPTTSFNGITQVTPFLSGGESFETRDFNYVKSINFEMYMANPYFASTTITNSTFAIASTVVHSTSVIITGCKVFPIFSFTSTLAWTSLEVKLNTNYGFHVDYSFTAGDVVDIYTSNSELEMYINNNKVDGFFHIDSTPFSLKAGLNTFDVKAQAGTLNIKYYERRL